MSVRVGICVSQKLGASITFAVGQSSEIGRYEVTREESLPGLGMTIDDFQIAGIWHDVTESLKSAVRYSIAGIWHDVTVSLKSAVRYSIALGPRFFS